MFKKKMPTLLKSITVLSSGTIIAQIIAFVASPLMTRLYSPSAIGVYTLLLTAVNMFGSVICGRYELAIVSVKEEDDARAIIKLSGCVCLIASPVACLGYTFFLSATNSLPFHFLITYAVLVVYLVVTGLTNIMISYNNRCKEYKLISSVTVIRSLGCQLTMIIGSVVQNVGLIASQLVGMLLGINRQAKGLKPHLKEIKGYSAARMKQVAVEHRQLPFFSAPAIFANSFAYSSLVLFLSAMFGEATLGFYSLSYRVLVMPLSLISLNISKAYFVEASREYERCGQYKQVFMKMSRYLLILSVPMVVLMMFVVPPLFSLVFGPEWTVSGEFVRILAPMFGVRFVVTSLSMGFVISKKQKIELIVQMLFLAASVCLFAIAKLLGCDVVMYLRLVCYTFSLLYIIHYVLLFYACRVNHSGSGKSTTSRTT